MEGGSSKSPKKDSSPTKEGNGTKDESHSIDSRPQDVCKPQSIAQPPPEPSPNTPQVGPPMAHQMEGGLSPRDSPRPHGGMSDTDVTLPVIERYTERFLQEMDAKAIALQLAAQGLIPEPVEHDIHQSKCLEDANAHLLTFLTRGASEIQVLQTFKVASKKNKYGRMSQFAAEILQQPQPGIQHCPCVEAQDPVSQEVCSGKLPEPLKHAKTRAVSRYQRPDFSGCQGNTQFTKVAVLQNKQKKQGDSDQGEFLKRFRDCGIRLSEGDKQVTVSHFLRKGSHQTRIIYGQPGTGKTTFLKHLCQRAANDEASDFSLILYFPLRVKAVSEALRLDNSDRKVDLDQLLRYYIPVKKKSSAAAKALLKCEGANVLIIFDGADEVRGLMDSRDGSLLGALLEDCVLPQAHFIVSTRPGGYPLLQQHGTLFYEILGFDKEAVESYVKEFFKREPGKGEAMLSDLRARPDLMGGVYVPMNLAIFCSIFEMGVAGRSSFPATMTECYKSYIARTVIREKQKVKKTYRVDPSLTDLPSDVAELLSSLGDLAFNCLTQEPPHYIFQDGEVRDAFHGAVRHDEILDDSTFAGLLHLHPDQDGLSSTLTFSHTTKQEWFAAYHLSLLPEAEQVAFWRKNRHNPKFAVVLKFFAGLTKLQSPVVNEAIFPTSGGGLPSKGDTYNPYLLYVFYALFESQNESLTQSIASQLNSHLNFRLLHSTPFDTMAISHCLTVCKHLTKLDAPDYLSPISFNHICSVVRCNPLLQSLTLGVDHFSTEDARALCEAALSLKTFNLQVGNCRTDIIHEALAKIFDVQPLEDLYLSLYSPSIEVIRDSTMLKEKVAHCHLKRIKLFGRRGLLPLLWGAKDNCSITDLDVNSGGGDEVDSAVATCGRTMHQLKKLSTENIHPLVLLRALGDRDCPLEHVTVTISPLGKYGLRSRYTEEQLAQLEEAASCAQVVKVVVNVSFIGQVSYALAAGFRKNIIVREVTLAQVVSKQVESLVTTLSMNTALTRIIVKPSW